MDYFKGYFDLNSQHNLNCSNRDPVKERRLFLKNIENINNKINLFTTKKFAFPHTNLEDKYSLKKQKSINDFGQQVNNDIYDLENNKYNNTKIKP